MTLLELPDVPEGSLVLLFLLIAAHVLADFLVQTETVAAGKETRFGPLLIHGLLTLVTHLVLLAPVMTAQLAVWAVALSVIHTLQDGVRSRVLGASGRTILAFVLDQAVHVGFAVGAWLFLTGSAVVVIPDHPELARWLPWLSSATLVLAGLVFSVKAGCTFVTRVLARFGPLPGEEDRSNSAGYGMGKTIGYLERTLVFGLVVGGQWAALGMVVAAKSIARYAELKDRAFADYYLIGTLSSLLVAILAGGVVRYLLS